MLWWYLYLKLQALPTMLQEKWVTCSVIFQAEKTNNQCEAVPKKDRIVRVKLPLRGGKWTFDLFQAEKLNSAPPLESPINIISTRGTSWTTSVLCDSTDSQVSNPGSGKASSSISVASRSSQPSVFPLLIDAPCAPAVPCDLCGSSFSSGGSQLSALFLGGFWDPRIFRCFVSKSSPWLKESTQKVCV